MELALSHQKLKKLETVALTTSGLAHADKGRLEIDLLKSYQRICGIDEVGRGCLAGPVCAAAVILAIPKLLLLPKKDLALIRDSKKLSASQRQKIIPIILRHTISHHIAFASAAEIDQLNILRSTFLAMRRAVDSLALPPSIILVDGNLKIPELDCPQIPLVGGDGLTFSIAAASILAKDARDSYMTQLESKFPGYGFDRHVGYGTKAHLEAIKGHGVMEEHRKSFAPIAQILGLR